MFKSLRFIAALGAVLFATVALAACGGGIPGDAVVQVDGNNVAKTTFEHWLQVAAASTAVNAGEKPVVPVPPNYTACISHLASNAAKSKVKTPTNAALKAQCATQYKSISHEVLGFLISSEWVLGEANHLGVKVSDEEVHKQFNKIRTTQFPTTAEFEKFIAKSGQTVSDLLLRVKLNMLSQKIQEKIVKEAGKATEAEIQKYYNQNKSRYGTPEKRSVQIILTKTEAEALAAKKEIESGKSFSTVAKEKSTDPSKANGGLLPEIVKGQEEKSLDQAIFTSEVNKLGGPVKTQFGYYIYEVKTIKPGNQQSLAQAKATIKQQLISTKQQAALAKFVKEFKKRWTEKTDCQPEYTVPDCSNYKAPKA